MSLSTSHPVPILVALIACVVSSGGLVVSMFAICLRSFLPTPKAPRTVLWTRQSSRHSRRYSAPPVLPHTAAPPEESEPLSRSIIYEEPQKSYESEDRDRHISFSVDRRSRLSRAVMSNQRRFSSFHRPGHAHSSASSPLSPRSPASTSAHSPSETVPEPREGSVSSVEVETASLCSRGSSLSRRNTCPRIPSSIRTVKRILNGGRRRSSAETADDGSLSEAEGSVGSEAHSVVSCKASLNLSNVRPKLTRSGITFSNPWTKSPSNPLRSESCMSPSRPSPKSLTRRFTDRLAKRSPSLPPSPLPRTQPYGAPYFAAMPYWSDNDNGSSEDEEEASKDSRSVLPERSTS